MPGQQQSVMPQGAVFDHELVEVEMAAPEITGKQGGGWMVASGSNDLEICFGKTKGISLDIRTLAF